MSWLEKLLPPRIKRAAPESGRKSVPEGVWVKCPACDAVLYQADLRLASGYVYYVSLNGVTGAANLDVDNVLKALEPIREATGLPVGVGFGIRDGQTARAIAKGADAVVIGSRLIQEIDAAGPQEAVARAGAFIRDIRQAMDQAG